MDENGRSSILQGLSEIIDDWDIRGLSSLVPVFKLENEELGLQIDELDYAESYTDAINFQKQ